MSHTPGPWHIGMKPGPMVYGPAGEQIVGLNVMLDEGEHVANCLRIVRACNAHDDMLAALEQALADSDMPAVHGSAADCLFPWRIAARAAIAKARGE